MNRSLVLLIAAAVLLSACVSTGGNPYSNEANPKEAARLNTQLGVDYMRMGINDRALAKLQRALKEDPDLASAHAAIALLYSREGQNGRAKKHYKRALGLSPHDAAIQNQYGTFLCQQGSYGTAMQFFGKAANNPNYDTPEVALTNAGVCETRQNNTDKASAYFRKALQINPNYSSALQQLAEISYRQGHYLQAKALLQRYDNHAKATAETLWLQVRTERALGDDKAAKHYAHELLSRFPASDQTQKLQQTQVND